MKKSKFMQEFLDFCNKGNPVQMAIGVILGAGMSSIVKNFTESIINPILGMLLGGGVDFSHLKITLPHLWGEVPVNEEGVAIVNTLAYGSFITEIINFLLVALVVFFIVKGLNKLTEIGKKKEAEQQPAVEPEEPKPSNEELLLTEIRDLLKDK